MRTEAVDENKWRNTSDLPRILRRGRLSRGGCPLTRTALGWRWAGSSRLRRRRWQRLREIRYRYPTITESIGARARAVSIGVRDLDLHEVLCDPHVSEDFLRILEDRRRVLVARAHMREDEESDPRFLRDVRGLPRRRMPIAVRLRLQRR